MARCIDRMSKDLTRRARLGISLPMLSTPAFISVAFVRGMFSGLLRGGRLTGSAERELLVQAGLAPDLLDQPSACITADQYAHLMRLLMGHFNDEALGFLSRPLGPARWPF